MQRPRTKEWEIHLFNRSIHPELLNILKVRTVKFDQLQICVRITPDGHSVEIRGDDWSLTELSSQRHAELPRGGHLHSRKLQGCPSEPILPKENLAYQMLADVEYCENDALFRTIQDEIIRDSRKGGMLHRFKAENDWELGAITFISLQARPGTLCITAFHTFPRERAIIKTVSMIEHSIGVKAEH